MHGHSALRVTGISLLLTVLGAALASGPAPADGATILETATVGTPPTTLIGIGGLQWLGARFTIAQQVQVDHIGTCGGQTVTYVPLSNAYRVATTVYDIHATILHLMGLDHEQLTYRYAGRDFRLTDVAGHVVREVFA